MKNLLNPKWLLYINTLPIIILFLIFGGEYSVIKSLLVKESLMIWGILASVLLVLGGGNLAYTLHLIRKERKIPIIYGVIALLAYLLFLFLYAYFIDDMVPVDVPRWMFSENTFLYVGTFLMPTLIYSLFVLVVHATANKEHPKAGMSFLYAIAIPLFWYLLAQIILPFWQVLGGRFIEHATLVLFIASTLTFLFFIMSSIYILSVKKSNAWREYQLSWKIPIAIILPIIGLLVNNGPIATSIQMSRQEDVGILGNFSSGWFFILAIINGILICLPNNENPRLRLLLFMGRSITFTYTFYFFLVFLPFLPLSIPAIIAFGAGFLMLTPLVLFVLHLNELVKDRKFLQAYFSTKTLDSIIVLGFLVLPFLIHLSYVSDKNTLQNTLDYIYNPNYEKSYTIDTYSLLQTLQAVKKNKRGRNDFIPSTQIPYLSAYFNWMVMNNMTLSDAKIATIERVFWGDTNFDTFRARSRDDKVNISTINSHSVFDDKQKAWVSWIDLEIKNHGSYK